jgi:nucleoporin NUP159
VGRAASQKKPTVEAVTKTVGKMMSMAEQKSADIDFLEAQLKNLDLSLASSMISNGEAVKSPSTPIHGSRSANGTTPGSAGSIYHTPDSKFGSSTRSSKSFRASQNGGLALISAEDRERCRAQAHRRKEAATMLKTVLEEKRKIAGAKR